MAPAEKADARVGWSYNHRPRWLALRTATGSALGSLRNQVARRLCPDRAQFSRALQPPEVLAHRGSKSVSDGDHIDDSGPEVGGINRARERLK